MSAMMKAETVKQTELLGTFIEKWQAGVQAWLEIADAYKACIEANIDLSAYVSPSMAKVLMILTSGRLIEPAINAISYLPSNVICRIASLPKPTQEDLWEDGADVYRHGEIVRARITDITSAEVSRLIDVLDGKGRILTPEEQKNRMTPTPTKRDHEVKLRLPYELVVGLGSLASKSGKSLEAFIKDLLKREIE